MNSKLVDKINKQGGLSTEDLMPNLNEKKSFKQKLIQLIVWLSHWRKCPEQYLTEEDKIRHCWACNRFRYTKDTGKLLKGRLSKSSLS